MTLYQYPSRTSDFALIPAGKFYTSRQNGPVLGIVLHITAGLQDLGLSGADGSAEGTAKWARERRPDVSWHVGVDSDSIVPCLPDTYTAWHAKGYNSRTFGIEISKLDVDWSDVPKEWVERTLRNAARALAPIVRKYDLPLELRTKAEVDSAIAANRAFGFVYHSTTSAGTRSDPGRNFPFARLIELIKAELAGTTTNIKEDDLPTVNEVWTTDLTKTGRIGGNDVNESPLEIMTRMARNIEYIAGLIKASGNTDAIAAAVVAKMPAGQTVDEATLASAFVTALTELANKEA